MSDQSHTWCEIASVARMLRRVLCGHGVVDVGRAVGVLFNRNRNRRHGGRGPQRGGSPPASHVLQRVTRAASLVPMMLLSAAAADTLHAPAEINLFSRLDGVREARAATMFATLRGDSCWGTALCRGHQNRSRATGNLW